MSSLSIFLIYLMVWMIIFFMSLPFGISVSENLEIMQIPPLSNDDFVDLVKKLTS